MKKYTITEMIAALKNRPDITFGNITMMDNAIADQIITVLESVETAIVNSVAEPVGIKETYHLAVDAGNISVLTFALVRSYGDQPIQDKNTQTIPLAPGKYKVRVKIPKSWLDNKIDEVFEVTVGENDGIVIGDACYTIRDKWSDFVDHTNCLDSLPEGQGMSIGTGGDGTFKTTVEITNA